MNRHAEPVIKDVVLVGAGHANIQVLRRFGMDRLPGVRLTLITRDVHTPYSGMLPGLIAGRYAYDEAHIDTAPLARFAGARLYHSAAIGIDLGRREVLCDNRPPVPYDVLAIDTGSMPNTQAVPGAAEHAIAVKPISRFLKRFETLKTRVSAGRGLRRIAVVGGGAAGVELILALESRLRRQADGYDPAGLSFVLVTATPNILPGFPHGFARRLRGILDWRRIDVVTGARVAAVEPGRLLFDGRAPIEADDILWTTQATAPHWLRSTGLSLDEDGFLKVGPTLQAEGQGTVFAAGDVAAFTPRRLPKSGVYAVRAGPVLAENIRRLLTATPLKPYKPQREAMYLVSDGMGEAVGTRNGVVFSGEWAWRWKDSIDRAFMERFSALPEMGAAPIHTLSPLADTAALREIAASPMRCGGCAAKVGPSILSRALSGLTPVSRADVLIGLDAPDDAAIVDTGGEALSVQSVDYFRAMIDDPYLFGRIAANHALGDIYAMGAAPSTALAIATVPHGLETKTEADLSAMLKGAESVLSEAGCALVGGHSSEGAELSLGFAVNGLLARGAALRKAGMRPGDALILTKPLGVGLVLAADMRGKAKARWLMAATRLMTQSSRAAADILRRHGARAATDVTGFGLIGHLAEIARASGVDAAIALHAVPLMDGAREVLAMEITSSLQGQNMRLAYAIWNLEEAARDPLYGVLFDPQTAGGLLASVPAGEAAACVEALHTAGYADAAIIGTARARVDAAMPITVLPGAVVPDPAAGSAPAAELIVAAPRGDVARAC